MRAPIGCVVVMMLGACATRAGYVGDPGTARPVDTDSGCASQPCGGSAEPVTVYLGISVLVGLALATLAR